MLGISVSYFGRSISVRMLSKELDGIILGGDPPYFHWNVSQVISGRDFYYIQRFQHTRLAIGLEVHIGLWTSIGGFEIVLSPVEIRGCPSGYIM